MWYEHVEVQHLVVPPLVLYLLPGARSALLEGELEQLTAIATRMYTVIMHKLAFLQLGTLRLLRFAFARAFRYSQCVMLLSVRVCVCMCVPP